MRATMTRRPHSRSTKGSSKRFSGEQPLSISINRSENRITLVAWTHRSTSLNCATKAACVSVSRLAAYSLLPSLEITFSLPNNPWGRIRSIVSSRIPISNIRTKPALLVIPEGKTPIRNSLPIQTPQTTNAPRITPLLLPVPPKRIISQTIKVDMRGVKELGLMNPM